MRLSSGGIGRADYRARMSTPMPKMPEKIRRMRKARGLTQAEFAEILGVSQSAISKWERGEDEPRPDFLRALAEMAGESMESFAFYDTGGSIPLTVIVVVGSVAAGVWQEATEWVADDRYTLSVPAVSDYMATPLFGLEVKGRSMDKVFPEGAILICAKFFDLNEQPQAGDYVVVHRTARDGTVEATVKEFEVDRDGRAWAWPRSTEPEFQQPLRLDASDGGVEEVRVVALVVGSYQQIRRRR